MKDNGLTVPRNTALRARREPKTRKPVTDMPDTVWGTDMTKTRTAQGWAYVHVVSRHADCPLFAPFSWRGQCPWRGGRGPYFFFQIPKNALIFH